MEGRRQRMVHPLPGRRMAVKAGPLDKQVENGTPLQYRTPDSGILS